MNNKNMIVYGGIGLAVLILIIVAVMMMKKEKYVGTAAFGTAPLQSGGLMLETDANGNLSTSATLPIGSIIIWSGVKSSIPVGWAVCDGTNNTPNLSGLFLQGVSDDSNLGVVSGVVKNTVQLLPENVPLWMSCSNKSCTNNMNDGSGFAVVTGNVESVTAGSNLTAAAFKAVGTLSNQNGTYVAGGAAPFAITPQNMGVYFIMKTQ